MILSFLYVMWYIMKQVLPLWVCLLLALYKNYVIIILWEILNFTVQPALVILLLYVCRFCLSLIVFVPCLLLCGSPVFCVLIKSTSTKMIDVKSQYSELFSFPPRQFGDSTSSIFPNTDLFVFDTSYINQ